MIRPKAEDYVFYQGEKFQVEFYFDEKGRMTAVKGRIEVTHKGGKWILFVPDVHIVE